MGIAERRAREREQRRELFIDTAQRLFQRDGYESTTMEGIARAAEFSKRSLYLYFEDKRDLFLAVVLRGLNILEELVGEAITSDDDGLQQLREIGHAYYEFSRQHTFYFDASIDFEMKDYHWGGAPAATGEFTRRCFETNQRINALVNAAVERAVSQGATTTLEPHQATLLMWGQILGIVQIIARRRQILSSAYGLDAQELFSHSLDATLSGLFGPGDSTRSRST